MDNGLAKSCPLDGLSQSLFAWDFENQGDASLQVALNELRRSGWFVARIRLNGSEDPSDLLKQFAAQLSFPAYFGNNWDALIDCLSDLHWIANAGVFIVLDRSRDLQQGVPETHSILRECIDAVIARLNNRANAKRLTVLWN